MLLVINTWLSWTLNK